MNRILLAVTGALALAASLPSLDQGASASARKRGTIFKEEVDGLVDRLAARGRAAGDRCLGGDSVLATAMALTAMGHCHRYYHVSDGPVVRPSIDFLFRSRQADGSFGAGDEAAPATAWVAEALSILHPDGYRAEVDQALGWLARHGHTRQPFQAAVTAVLAEVRADRFPQDVGKPAAAAAQAQAPDAAPLQAAELLVRLVACQVANRHLDQQQDAPQATFSKAQQKAFDWLLGQQSEGVFSVKMGPKTFPDPGFTALGLSALQTKPQGLRTEAEQKVIEQGLRWLLAQQNKDGSFGQANTNYVTCAVVMALARWTDPAVKPALMKAQAYVLAIQNTEQNGYQRGDRDYGSIGYGGDQRGDVSNLQFALEALRLTDLPQDHEAFAKAIVFLQRTQNLKSVNDFSGKVPDDEGKLMQVTSGDDGGSAYYPGNSPAGYIDLPDGTRIPRSYGSMTYAMLKSYTMAGLKGDDPRIQAAVRWIQGNWNLAENPGADPALGEKARYQGLYYYYMVLAQALAAAGIDQLTVPGAEAKDVTVQWRSALREHLEAQQKPDGSWKNDRNDRWFEGMDVLCTCYAMLALERCR